MINTSISGRFRLDVIKCGVITKSTGWFNNLITNSGMDRVATAADYLNYCNVGSGSRAPEYNDTSLASRISYIAASSTLASSSISGGYLILGKSYSFLNGLAAGNVSEIGIGWNTTGSLFSRALVKDGLGNPTTITVLSDEDLVITYELKIRQPTIDFIGDISGINFTIRSAKINDSSSSGWGDNTAVGRLRFAVATNSNLSNVAFSGGISSASGYPSGQIGTSSTGTGDTYVPGSYKTNTNITFSTTSFNGIMRSMLFYPGPCAFQVEFDPLIQKTNLQTLRIGISFSWSRE